MRVPSVANKCPRRGQNAPDRRDARRVDGLQSSGSGDRGVARVLQRGSSRRSEHMKVRSGGAGWTMRTAAVVVALGTVACGTAKTASRSTETPTNEPLIDAFSTPPAAGTTGLDEKCAPEPVYFAFDSSDLEPSAREAAGRNARCAVSARSPSVRIVGMTDPRGVEEYNLALGDRRARAVSRYMTALGVSVPFQVSPTTM
jgi:outer membrane protein OmpA-like peptidoglycan-associated protein